MKTVFSAIGVLVSLALLVLAIIFLFPLIAFAFALTLGVLLAFSLFSCLAICIGSLAGESSSGSSFMTETFIANPGSGQTTTTTIITTTQPGQTPVTSTVTTGAISALSLSDLMAQIRK
jgi:hypothetical protein